MPVILSAKKKVRVDLRKQKVNQKVKTGLKLAIKTFRTALSETTLKKAYSALDTAVKKGVLTKNGAARKKSNLVKLLAKKTPPSGRKTKKLKKVRKD